MIKRLLLIAALWIISFPALAQNPTCPTRPVGDSSNACASTAFVSGATGYTSGKPWCDPVVLAQQSGVTINTGAVDATPYFNTCRTTLENLNGGMLRVSQGSFCLNNFTINATNKPIILQGAGNFSTQFINCFSLFGDQTVLTVDSTQNQVNDISVVGGGIIAASTFGSTHDAISIGPTCVRCSFNRIRMQGGLHGMATQSSDGIYSGLEVSQWYGSAGIYRYGAGGTVTAGNRFLNNKLDGVFPFGFPPALTTVTNWAAGTPVNAQSFVSSGGYIYQVQANCTTGGVAPTLQKFGTAISDGTCVGQLVAANTSYVFQFDSGAWEDTVEAGDAGGPGIYAVYAMTHTLGGTPPSYNRLGPGLSFGGGNIADIYIAAGDHHQILAGEMGACVLVGCAILQTDAAYTGSLEVTGGNYINAFSAIGLDIRGASSFTVSNITCRNNSTNCINVGAGVSNFHIDDVTCATPTPNCVVVNAGASDRYSITNVVGDGTITPANLVVDNGTGRNKTVCGIQGTCPYIGQSFGIGGATSGLALFQSQAAQGTPTYTLPTGSGTFTVSASGNTALNATTGALTGATNGTTNAMLATMAQGTFKGRAAAAGTGDPQDLTKTQAHVALSYPLWLLGFADNIDMNSANTDTALTMFLPTTNYTITAIRVQNCSTSMTTATGGVFTSTGGGGTTVSANAAVAGVTSAAANTSGNGIALTLTQGNNTWWNAVQLYFRVGTAQGAAATCNVYAYGYPMP